MFIALAVCGLTYVCLVQVSRTVISIFELSWNISECVNVGTYTSENRTPYLSLVTELFAIYAQQTPVHLVWGLL